MFDVIFPSIFVGFSSAKSRWERGQVGWRHWVSVPADFSADDLALFVGENIPDGTRIAPGQPFDKIWTMRNAGPIPWSARWLTRQGDPGVPGWLASPHRIAVADAAPGQEITMTMPMVAPLTACSCIAYFKMTDRAGRPYFPASNSPMYCTITVDDTLQPAWPAGQSSRAAPVNSTSAPASSAGSGL